MGENPKNSHILTMFACFIMHSFEIWGISSAEKKNCTLNVQVRSIFIFYDTCFENVFVSDHVHMVCKHYFSSKFAAHVVQFLWREVILKYEHQRNFSYDMGHVNIYNKGNNVSDLLWTKVAMKNDRYTYF